MALDTNGDVRLTLCSDCTALGRELLDTCQAPEVVAAPLPSHACGFEPIRHFAHSLSTGADLRYIS